MARETFKVEGLAELDQALGQLKEATALRVLRRVAVKRLEPIADDARARSPEQYGGLEKSITVTTRRPKGGDPSPRQSTVEAFMGPGRHPKGVQQEFGNVDHPPQPFIRPAWDGGVRPALEGVRSDLKDEIEKTAKRVAARQAALIKRNGG